MGIVYKWLLKLVMRIAGPATKSSIDLYICNNRRRLTLKAVFKFIHMTREERYIRHLLQTTSSAAHALKAYSPDWKPRKRKENHIDRIYKWLDTQLLNSAGPIIKEEVLRHRYIYDDKMSLRATWKFIRLAKEKHRIRYLVQTHSSVAKALRACAYKPGLFNK